MILGIDASNIRTGGGVTHLMELLDAAEPGRFEFSKVLLWSGASTLLQIQDKPWLEKVHLRVLDRGLPYRAMWQRFVLPRLAIRGGCDLLFVPGGTYAGRFHPVVAMSQNLLPFEWRELRRFGWTRLTLKWLLLRWTQSRTFRTVDGVIFLTRYAREVVFRITGQLQADTVTIPHGVRERFSSEPRPQLALEEYSTQRPFRILYVSIVDMYKHQWHVVEGVASLRQAGLPVQLELVGPAYAPALRRLEAVIARCDPERQFVMYSGAVPHSDMHVKYQQSDMAVFASSCETFGQILTEAMSAGLPVACSDRSAMPELLGDAGVYFNPEDPGSIANAIKAYLESPDLRREKAWAGYDRVKEFSWTRCANDTFSFLRDVALKANGGKKRVKGRA